MKDNCKKLLISEDAELELNNINEGVFAPLTGFLGEDDYRSVLTEMHLLNGHPWTVPVTLDISKEQIESIKQSDDIFLVNHSGNILGEMSVNSIFKVDLETDLKFLFGTDSIHHPGVKHEISRSEFRVGGEIKLINKIEQEFTDYYLNPTQTKALFKRKRWKSIVGFQTRNPLHRAHEYLHRLGMELMDGLFIQPLIGWKKADDFSPIAVVKAHQKMFEAFYPSSSAVFGTLLTPMRYAGPREAVFHAIIRRNFGCTHFIVGRDHAGVGDFYGKYEAQELCSEFNNLGIEILALHGPYYCKKCEGIVTEKSCSHGMSEEVPVSGTEIRKMLTLGKLPPVEFMRPEISNVLINLAKKGNLFCGKEKIK